MKVQIIKREIPTEISEQGGAYAVIVNKETVDLETSVDEAKDALIVVGDKLLVKGMFVGLCKSIITGIERDGNARQLGDFITFYPVPTGEFDLEMGWDPAANGVKIRARLLNEMEIDISKWEFEDVTPGRQSFKIESVKAGPVTGVVRLDSPVELNGSNLPTTAQIRVDWAVADTALSGTVPAAKVTSSVSRVDIAADAFASLNVPANDGKRLELTVRGNYANAKVSGTLKYVAPPAPTIASVKDKTTGEAELIEGDPVVVDGTNLGSASDTVTVSWKDQQGQPQSKTLTAAEKTSHTATQVEIAAGFWQSVTLGDDTSMTFKVTTAGGSAEKTVEASK